MKHPAEEKFLKTVREHDLLSPGDHVILGLSGGADSTALFALLADFCPKILPVKLHPVHVNHMIRGNAADEDQRAVEELCRSRGLVCRSIRFDCIGEARCGNMTEEEAGRKKRYELFDEAAEELLKQGVGRARIKIATAHHADDQAETILLHLLRGSGVDGLAGMAYSRKDEAGFTLIRPLLDCRKSELQEYCGLHGLVPREDQTNQDPSYGRNRIRLELLPYLRSYNPKIEDALIRLGKSAAEDRAYLQNQAEKLYGECRMEDGGSVTALRRDKAAALPHAMRIRLLRLALAEAGLAEDFTARHLEALDHILRGGDPSAETDLPHGMIGRCVYDRLEIGKLQKYRPSAKGDGKESGPAGRVRVLAAEDLPHGLVRGSYACFDEEKLIQKYGADAAGKICWRTRKPGDYIAIPGGRKKLHDVLIDDKVPKSRRDSLSFAAVGSEVLFLPAWEKDSGRARYSHLYLVDKYTKKIVLVEKNCRI
ncbi:MAG: tRNA lysidine(34) synthetase TilS [Eubacterium sp.]|jgi:tRNA(Ile)-lysidine synthase|nr:tRNA lysidine(34) synthetase TilS [Eubacterium sp.]MCH4047144.1 tRNA lysidine(34) synthetase TilS [Eubacterium sp.]MCH4080241.1 tRNA lysidine(34) synthetase TilS [Eubacterium sp.]MCH4111158.1 tRNA lysidine(34) synthetase TilS [Eubacterium sp.]MCI1307790.1 tRNA lysidine(34) synthetase TilS [Eubacterium sp.]